MANDSSNGKLSEKMFIGTNLVKLEVNEFVSND